MRRALGKGLAQLLGEQSEMTENEVSVDAISPNPRQPRKTFSDEGLQELAQSIKEVGVLQPLVVKPLSEGRFELIAGERRLRASKLAGLRRVPVVIRSAGSQNSLEMAIIENVQREDISAVDAARAYRQLMDEFDLTQDDVADKVGKSRSAVANTVRLLRLPERILDGLQSGLITEGHARALLSVAEPTKQLALYEKILASGLTVREAERAATISTTSAPQKNGAVVRTSRPSSPFRHIEDKLSEKVGSPVKLQQTGKGGRIVIEFFSEDDLARVLEALDVQL